MADKSIHLGLGVSLDLQELLATRALVGGNSGSGKSYCERKMCEQMVNLVPTIILDREGEYATLREKRDVVLVGRGGEVGTHVETAAKLARKLAELRVSAVIDLYELDRGARRRYVRLFLETYLSLPRRLWAPTVIVLDESHEFAPEAGREAESAGAVIGMMDQGRKRGVCGILATQRLSKISKDATSEANNLLLGRFAQDIDLRRVSDLLGFSGRSEWPTMQSFKPGEFFAVGPAFQHDGVKRFRVDPVETTHARPGTKQDLEPPKPSKAILKVAPELADLQKQVAEEKNELEQLRATVKELSKRSPAPAAATSKPAAPSAAETALRAQVRTLEAERDASQKREAVLIATLTTATKQLAEIDAGLQRLIDWPKGTKSPKVPKGNHSPKPIARAIVRDPNADPAENERWYKASQKLRAEDRARRPSAPADAEVGTGGMRRMLVALAQHPEGLSKATLGLLAQISAKGGTFSTYMGRLRAHGWVEDRGGRLVATPDGVAALGAFDPLPTGREAAQYWLDWCGNGGQRRILEVLIDAGRDGMSKADLGEVAGIASSGGTFSTYLGRLKTANLIEKHKGGLRVVETLLG